MSVDKVLCVRAAGFSVFDTDLDGLQIAGKILFMATSSALARA
jgi:hypothetical protein